VMHQETRTTLDDPRAGDKDCRSDVCLKEQFAKRQRNNAFRFRHIHPIDQA
jgi:hypothetical protein